MVQKNNENNLAPTTTLIATRLTNINPGSKECPHGVKHVWKCGRASPTGVNDVIKYKIIQGGSLFRGSRRYFSGL